MSNRLAMESSPYLRAHAEDPVDWYPWGLGAFEAARSTGKPVFLSIGYASCHWCHVMHRESFSAGSIAEKLNRSFVSIKVDRESRPDVDEHYMAYISAVTGRGGWPMSVFTTPNLVPIFGGTYFPPDPAYGMPSFGQVVDQIAAAFELRPEGVADAAEEALDYLGVMFRPQEPVGPDIAIAEQAALEIISYADARNGGLGRQPKFPQAPVIDFLLAHAELGHPGSLAIAERALEAMVRGGIYDQAGGGLARYATDAEWLVPHFEKMLYDNAQLLGSLARLHTLAPRAEWAHTIRATADFMERDLEIDGAYASSLDADTNGREGATYVWDHAELSAALTPDELALAERHLGVCEAGNWEGENILTRRGGREEDAVAVDALLGKLLELRQRRPQPARDDKVIVSWNALAAVGLLDAGIALGDTELADKGVTLTRLLLDEGMTDDGGVRRLLRDPASAGVRILEDAAALCLACLRVGEVADPAFVDFAARIFERAVASFYDDGTWYSTAADTELPVRPREQHDNPLPSGAAMAARCAVLLGRLTGFHRYFEIAEQTLSRQATLAKQAPASAGTALLGILELTAAREQA